MEQRQKDLDRLYQALAPLPTRMLRDCHGRLPWPQRGVYFFFEPGEVRAGTDRPRIVRVGTHAVAKGSRTKLWNRLSQHRGTRAGGGNHRGSIFRLLTGAALLARNGTLTDPGTWGDKSSAPRAVRENEQLVEQAVSTHIGAMPFTWITAFDESSKDSIRAVLERNTIALLSSLNGAGDQPSRDWLGRSCPRPAVQQSGLWNIRHTSDNYDPGYLDLLEAAVEETLRSHV